MVKLRLMRMGKKKQPTYRVVAADARSPRNGRFIEIIGHYNPRTEPSTVVIDNDKAVHWLSEGAQPTDRHHGTQHHASQQPGGPRHPDNPQRAASTIPAQIIARSSSLAR